VPTLVEAGYKPLFRYRGNDGQVTEHSFQRWGAKIEFFRMTHCDDNFRYHVYAVDPNDEHRHVELLAMIPAQPMEPIEFLGRRWLKPADHERELEAVYGDWRTPDPHWSFLDDRAIVERRVWEHSNTNWDGSVLTEQR
jgi:hypothetical protein